MKNKIEMINDRDGAREIMMKTVAWCERKGLDMPGSWRREYAEEYIDKEIRPTDGEYFVFVADGKAVGACILQDWDSNKEWKKYGYAKKCLYLNKFCVADEYHGTGVARGMLDAVKRRAVAGGFESIRCVALEKVAPIYINNGFFPHWTFVGAMTGRTFVRLAWYRWTPGEFETIWRGAGRFNLRRIFYKFIKRVFWFL